MKKIFLFSIVFCCLAALALAQETTITLKGYIIDNKTASSFKPEDLSVIVKNHPKEFALLPESVAGGYAIFADGILYRFSHDSSTKIVDFLKKRGSTLEVVITAKKIGNDLNLISIANQ